MKDFKFSILRFSVPEEVLMAIFMDMTSNDVIYINLKNELAQ
jgi:hypothetical protein